MTTRRFPIPTALLAAAFALTAGTAPAASPDPAKVREVFAAKCTQCHGPDLPKPKGKFGYVTDLEKVAGNPKLVVPSRPDESPLWERVRDGKMPPASAHAGPLTAAEKETVHDWIAAGAPATMPEPPEQQAAPPAEAKEPPPPPFFTHLLGWVGRFHILVVHFPIALLTAAALGEAWCLLRRRREPWAPVRFCVLLGAVSAVVAAALGWIHAAAGGFGASELLTAHRWAGTSAAVLAVGALLLSEMDARRGRRSWLGRVAVFAVALLVGVAGHLGGSLVHGAEFLKW
jgi:mono/diheme cytochrome c family protein